MELAALMLVKASLAELRFHVSGCNRQLGFAASLRLSQQRSSQHAKHGDDHGAVALAHPSWRSGGVLFALFKIFYRIKRRSMAV